MLYPQEIEVWYVLPGIRRELAKYLVKKGLTQKEIALKFGITESAISQYLKDKRANSIKFDSLINKAIEDASKKILKDHNVMNEIQKIIGLMRRTRTICKIHHEYDPNLPKDCEVCIYDK